MQQLITTVGTLVVVVAGFYFGSTAVSGAVTAGQTAAASAAASPTVTGISPREGDKGRDVSFEIVGTGFRSPREVRFVRGDDRVLATDILSSSSKVQGKVNIGESGVWDIVVANEDGKEARLTGAFSSK